MADVVFFYLASFGVSAFVGGLFYPRQAIKLMIEFDRWLRGE